MSFYHPFPSFILTFLLLSAHLFRPSEQVATSKKGLKRNIRVLRRFPFSSTLKRMATVSVVDWQSDRQELLVAVKARSIFMFLFLLLTNN